MITKNYTPGPFQVSSRVSTLVETFDGRSIATTSVHYSTLDPNTVYSENDANAVLFAATPELVEASEKSLDVLRDYLERMTDGDCDPALVAEIKGAIDSSLAALTKAGVLTFK